MIRILEQHLQEICTKLGYPYPAGVVITEPPPHIGADYSVNLAMQLTKSGQGAPREIAERLKTELEAVPHINKVELAGPGFLNVSLGDHWYLKSLRSDLAVIPQTAHPQRIIVEYVSANPSGPLHIGNARGGPIGESISRILESLGHTVTREFYVNDIGGQADTFAASVLHYYRRHFGHASEFPEKGYPAPYVKDLAEEIADAEGERILQLSADQQVEAMRLVAIKQMVEKIRHTTDRMNIHFDAFFWQSQLESSGLSHEVLALLKHNDATIEKEGATWLKSGLQEDDRETVLVKSDGHFGYFLDDIAYHQEKLVKRHFDTAIVLLGANHSGHLPRMQAAMRAIGIDPKRYQAVMYQYVQLKEDGETRRMAKREGSFITADAVLDEVPLEVFNYFMLSKANETHLDFDLQLAKDTSEKNPIYYIQYAHARICSVLERVKSQGIVPGEISTAYQLSQQERQLLRHLLLFPDLVTEIATSYRTHLLPNYLHELATRYHHFYAHQRIIADTPEETAVRVQLSQVTAAVLKKGLNLLNIQALEKM